MFVRDPERPITPPPVEEEEDLSKVGLELIPILTSITTSPFRVSGLVYRVICRTYREQTSIIVGSNT